MKKKQWLNVFLAVALILSLALFAACSSGEEETPLTVEVESVTVSPATLSLLVGETETLTATVLPADATDKTVAWESSDEDVASVTAEGKVTALAHGTATVTATAGGKSASCTVTVGAITSEWDGTVPSEQPASYVVDADGNVTIGDAQAFAWFAQQAQTEGAFAGKTVTLAANIDLGGYAWTPIAAGERSGNSYAEGSATFAGVFDGNGLEISGLSISALPADASADYAVGLFGIVDGGTVKNLALSDVSIDVEDSECAAGAVGILLGGGTVENVSVAGSVRAGRGNAGVVGRLLAAGTVRNCSNAAQITGVSSGGNTGGVVGAAYYTDATEIMTIANCTNTAAVQGKVAVGGIVGFSAAFVKNCTNSGAVSGAGTSVGGIVGEQQNFGAVQGCVNTADIVNDSTSFGTGGIVGWVRYSGAASAYLQTEAISVTGNRNEGSVTGGSSAGGIVGHMYNAGTVRENVNTAALISSSNFAAGIVGSLQLEMSNSFADEPDIDVVYNASTTPLDSIVSETTCRHQFAYNNNDSVFTVGNNFATESELNEALARL